MFNKYYQDELAYLREIGREFARAHPEAAHFVGETSQDPDVERLLEGFAFLTARIRQDPRWAGLPIVIITAYADEERRRQGMQLGAQAYITKSRFDQGNLLETVARLVG